MFLGVGVGRVSSGAVFAYVFALLFGFSLPKKSRENSLDVRSCVSGFFWIGCPEFFGEIFSGPEMPHFCCPKTACEKFSLALFFTRWFLEGFGARAPLLVLEMFLVGSGCAFLYGFLYQIQGVLSAVFGFRRSFFALSLPPFLPPPPPLLGAGPGFPSSSFSAPGCRHRTTGTCAGGSS